MSAPPAGAGGGDWPSQASSVPLQKKRTKIVFLNPTEIADWGDLKSTNEHKLFGETDLLEYEELLKNQPRKSMSTDSPPGPSESSKRRRKSKNGKNGAKKKFVDPTQPWLEDTDSDEQDIGLEDELDDDEYFRRLEEEKLREDEEEARRKREMSEARALARARGQISRALVGGLSGEESLDLTSNTFVRTKGRVPRATRIGLQSGRPQSLETSDSDASFSEFGDGTMSSIGGSRLDCDEFDNPRSLYPHEEEDENELMRDEDNLEEKDDLPPPPSPSDRAFEVFDSRSSVSAKPTTDATIFDLASTDSHTLRMLSMDPIRLRYCSPPLHLPTSASDLVCPSQHLMDAFEVYEVLIRYGYLLRLSPFKVEDFVASLVANENSTLLAEVHMALLRALLREDDATGTWMYSIDCKDSVALSYYLLDRYNWPYLLASYLWSIKSTEQAARASATSLTALTGAACGLTGASSGGAGVGGMITAALDTILTATVFPEDLIPLDPSYPFVSVDKRVAVLRGMVNLFLATRSVRGDQLRDGYLTHEDHCRACQQSGEVLCCDGCTAVFHLTCLNPPMTSIPPANWICPVCVKKQVPGVHECLTEEERTRKLHRREPLGSDRAGRVYWYIGRRILVEPTDFTQREPCLPGIMDGIYDPHWQQAFADQFLDDSDGEDGDTSSSEGSIVDENTDTTSMRPLRRVRCNPNVEYASEPSLYYYSTIDQVMELRARLSPRWEPWLCQRLDALMPRLHTEMPITMQLTVDGLDTFCRLRPDFERVQLNRALEWSAPDAPRSHVIRVFALLEAESKRSQLRMKLEGDETEEAADRKSIDELLKNPPTLDLGFLEPRAPDHLPDDLLNELPNNEECSTGSLLGVLVTCDVDTCLVHNHDGMVTRVAKPHMTTYHQGLCSTLLTPKERASYGLSGSDDRDQETESTGSTPQPPLLRAYRLSDEGSWRSWSNLYTVGVWLGSEQQPAATESSGTGKLGADGGGTTVHGTQRTTEEDGESGKSANPTALVNVLFSRGQLAEDRERRRVLGNKFTWTDAAVELWNYMEPPLLASYYTDLVELLKCPCDLDDNLFRTDWPASPWRLLDVARFTIAYMEAQIPLAFFTPAWRSLRKQWLSRLMDAPTPAEIADALATLEACLRPLCFQRIWFGSVGHLDFERTTAPQREEDRRVRQLDRSATSSSGTGASNLAPNLIRTKTPKPVRHTVWKSRGEEYRRLGGDGWMWLSCTRRSTYEETAALRKLHPPIGQLAESCKSTTTTTTTKKSSIGTRGLQHGIGWGVCPEYLQGQVPVKPPKASECRGHVLHPITGIPLYLNTRREPYIIPPDVLRKTQPSFGDGAQSEGSANVVAVTPKATEESEPSAETSTSLLTESISDKCSGSVSPGTAVPPAQSKESSEPEVTEPPVVNVCFGLSERIHFPPPLLPPAKSTASCSRRQRFRLDDLLTRRQAAAKSDREVAELAQTDAQKLEQEIKELEEQRTQLQSRLTDLAQQAQDARTEKAKAVKARQAAAIPAVQSSATLSNSLIMSTAGRSIDLSALQQQLQQQQPQQQQLESNPSAPRRLIQHSFISTSSGNRYRILPQTTSYSGDSDQAPPPRRPTRSSRRRKLTRSRRRSGDDEDDDDDEVVANDDDDEDYDPSAEFGRVRGQQQQLRRSARRQRAVRLDPDFIVDFDDDDDEEGEQQHRESVAGRERMQRRGAGNYSDEDGYSDEDAGAEFSPRPRSRFTTLDRLPQFDGAGDSASPDEEDTNSLTLNRTAYLKDSTANGPNSLPKKPCLLDGDKPPAVSTSVASHPLVSGIPPGSRPSGIINRIVRLVRTEQNNNSTTCQPKGGSGDSQQTSVSQSSTPNLVTLKVTPPNADKVGENLDGAKSISDGLRLVMTSTNQFNSQLSTSTATVDTTTATPCSATAPAMVNLPPGYRLVSLTPSSGGSIALPSAPVRLVSGNLLRTVTNSNTVSSSASSAPTTSSCTSAALSVTGSNTVRLVLQSGGAGFTTLNTDGSQNIILTPASVQADGITINTTTTTSDSSYVNRCQPAILRRTLAGAGDLNAKSAAVDNGPEFRLFTVPQTRTQSIASLVATNTARQMAGAVSMPRRSSSSGGAAARPVDRTRAGKKLMASFSRAPPLIKDNRAVDPTNTPRPLAPRPGLRPVITLAAGMISAPVTQSNEAQLALDRAVTEASEHLEKVDAEAADIKRKLLEIDQKLKQAQLRLAKLRSFEQYANQSTSAPYSLLRQLRAGDKSVAASEMTGLNSVELEDHLLLPADLPPVNHYVWPPVEWPEAKKRGFASKSSLFRLNPRNLRGLILAAGRRELPGFDAEKKRLVQVVWPYPTAKPSLAETWRFRLSQLRLTDTEHSQPGTSRTIVAGQNLANLVLLLRTLWHVIRWDDLLADPPEGDHVLDELGHPCLREVTDYADSGSAKSGEPAYCTRRIIGIQPLDRFWLRANYLVQLTHTRPGRERTARSRKSRTLVTRSGRRSIATRRPWATGFDSRRRRRRKKPDKRRNRDDPDYNPIEDEPWRSSLRRSSRRRRRRGSDNDDDDDDGSNDDDDDDDREDDRDLDDSSDASGTTVERGDRVSQIEEVWMSEESLRMWEIRVFMNTYLPPCTSDYLQGLTGGSNANNNLSGKASTLQSRRKPARLPLPSISKPSEAAVVDETGQIKPTLDEKQAMLGLSTTVPLSMYVDAHTARRMAPEAVSLDGFPPTPANSSSNATVRRRRPPLPDIQPSPAVSTELIQARARARSLAATRAARASVAARKARAERMIVDQRARAIRAQLITRRRLYLNLARALADEAVVECKEKLFGNDESDSTDEEVADDDVDEDVPVKRSPIEQLPKIPMRRPRGRPPGSGRYRNSRGLRRPLTTSQMPATEMQGMFGSMSKVVPSPRPAAVDAEEEQENKPDWIMSYRGAANSYRPRMMRRGSIPRRRGRVRGRGIVRPRIPHPLLLESPSNSPKRDQDSSAASTPSTCPGLGNSRLEALLTMTDEEADTFKPSVKWEHTDPYTKPSYTEARGSLRGRRGRGGRVRGGGRGTKREAGTGTTPGIKPCPIDSPTPSVRSPEVDVKQQQQQAEPEKSESDGLYCLCRTPYDPSREYLGCDLCQDWFHFECVGLTPSDASKLGDSWHCPDCRHAEETANEMLYCICRTPYEPTRVYIACDRCDEWYHAECVGLTAQQAATHAGTYLCPRCSGTAEAPKKKKEEPNAVAPTLYETAMSVVLQAQLLSLLQELREHKMSWPFLQFPPDPVKYPAVSSLKNPKSLPRITDLLARGQYATLGDFSFAMNSLFFDARTLFLKGTPEFNCTEIMEALFVRKMKDLKTRSTPS